MWKYCLKRNIFSVFYVITQVNCGFLRANVSTESETLSEDEPAEKCKFMFCSCADILNLGGVYCEGSRDNFIHNLTFTDSIHLPEGVLQGLHVKFLFLDNPKITVTENFLQGINYLHIFIVKQSSIEIIPVFSHIKYTIREIIIRGSRLTYLGGENLQNLAAILVLDFSHNQISHIDPDVFKGTENANFLDLSYNKLRYIPQNLLSPMKDIHRFYADHNYLLSVDSLFSTRLPKVINLSYNSITNASSILRFNVEGDWKTASGSYHYPSATVGIRLNLAFNQIRETPKSFFSYNADAYNDTPVYVLYDLDLRGNELKTLSTSLRYASLDRIDVSRNKIEDLTEENFLLVYHAKAIFLKNNEIRRIDSFTFKPFKDSLTFLEMSFNKIASINGSIRNFSELSMLILSHNLIQFIAEDEFIGLNKLSLLHLDSNHITSLGQLQHMSKLTRLNVSENALESLRKDQLPKNLISMDFSGNILKCDCHMLQIIGWIEESAYIKTDTKLCLQADLENRQEEMKNCPDMCSCRCTKNSEDPFMFVDCSSKNLTVVPQLLKNNITATKDTEMITSDDRQFFAMDQNTYPSFYFEDRILGISLENNNLKSINGVFLPPNLTQLYLSNNKLSWFPVSIITNQLNLKQVSLSGNPWKCDCNALKFKNWLTSNYHSILDIDQVGCGISDAGEANLNGRILWKLTELDLCPKTDTELVVKVSLCVLLSFIIIFFVAKTLYRKNELIIKMFLYDRGFHFVKEDIGIDKLFDAFLSFSHYDDEFIIKDIISMIEEKDPNIRLCLHYRHFLAGELISKNITYAVQNSSRTVLFLSRNFHDSEWCILEFRSAYMQRLKDKAHRIIAMKIGDQPKNIHPEIKLFLATTTFLTWGEKRFWEKLLFVLSPRSSIRNTVPRNTGNNDIVFSSSSDL